MPDHASRENDEPFEFASMMQALPTNTSDQSDADADEIVRSCMWREILIENVRRGVTTPQEAEDIVARRQAAPLFRRAERIGQFDAGMKRWTPEMTLSWIATRDPHDVHRHHPPSYNGVSVWLESAYIYLADEQKYVLRWDQGEPAGTVQPGHQLHELEDVFYPDGYYGFAGEKKAFPDLADVFPTLRSHLEKGTIKAWGLPQVAGEPYKIEKELWEYADFHISPTLGGVLAINGVDRYHRVKFEGVGVVIAYPPREGVLWSSKRVRQWKTNAVGKSYRDEIVRRLQEVYPDGFPETSSNNDRDTLIEKTLYAHHLKRWARKTERDLDAFRKAMDRIVEPYLDNDVAEVFEFL